MITGDYHHTAIAVARDVGMLDGSAQVIVIDVSQSLTPAQEAAQLNPPLLSPGKDYHVVCW